MVRSGLLVELLSDRTFPSACACRAVCVVGENKQGRKQMDIVKELLCYPTGHSSSVLKGVHRALKDSGASMETTLINGRFTKTATVDLCCTVLDNMVGSKWDEWRQSSGLAFKRSLREHVSRLVSAGQVEQAHTPVKQAKEQQVEGVETKAVVLRKALRTINIDGLIRVDERSGMVSGIDVIRMLCPEATSDYAAQMLKRVLEKDDREPFIKPACRTSRLTAPDINHLLPTSIHWWRLFACCPPAPPESFVVNLRKQFAE